MHLQDRSGYSPSTVGGKHREKLRLEKEIHQQLFSAISSLELEELEAASRHLETSMGRMSTVQWGSARARQDKQSEEMLKDNEDP